MAFARKMARKKAKEVYGRFMNREWRIQHGRDVSQSKHYYQKEK